MKNKKQKFNCDVNGGIMVVGALRYALGRHTYVPKATQDWITDNWESLDTKTKCVIVRDVLEHLYEESKKSQSPITDIDVKDWQKFAIERYSALNYEERKYVDQSTKQREGMFLWFEEFFYGSKIKV